jgi:ATP-dependent Clp protease ATP-binding subunit ClpA
MAQSDWCICQDTYEALSKYGTDLVSRAESGLLDPVIGRDDEVRRAIQVPSNRDLHSDSSLHHSGFKPPLEE